jgi:hypothetical protein
MPGPLKPQTYRMELTPHGEGDTNQRVVSTLSWQIRKNSFWGDLYGRRNWPESSFFKRRRCRAGPVLRGRVV